MKESKNVKLENEFKWCAAIFLIALNAVAISYITLGVNNICSLASTAIAGALLCPMFYTTMRLPSDNKD